MVRSPLLRSKLKRHGFRQSPGVDLAALAGAPGERVRARDAVGTPPGGARVDPHKLAEQRAAVLAVADRPVLVAGSAAVAEADVQEVVGTEGDQAAVVVVLRLALTQDGACAARVGAVGARRRPAVLDDARRPGAVGVRHVEPPRRRVVGREGHRKQPLLAAATDPPAQIEERPGQPAPAADDLHGAALLDDEQAPLVARRRRQVDRLVEAADPLQAHPAGCRLRVRRGGLRAGGGGAARLPHRRHAVARTLVLTAAGNQRGGAGERGNGRGAAHPTDHGRSGRKR